MGDEESDKGAALRLFALFRSISVRRSDEDKRMERTISRAWGTDEERREPRLSRYRLRRRRVPRSESWGSRASSGPVEPSPEPTEVPQEWRAYRCRCGRGGQGRGIARSPLSLRRRRGRTVSVAEPRQRKRRVLNFPPPSGRGRRSARMWGSYGGGARLSSPTVAHGDSFHFERGHSLMFGPRKLRVTGATRLVCVKSRTFRKARDSAIRRPF